MELRAWQSAAMAKILTEHLQSREDNDFFVKAGVGAGKTMFSIATAKRLFEMGFYTKIICVAPQRSVRQGFTETAARFGIQLNHIIDSSNPNALLEGYHGLSLTYAGLISTASVLQHYIDEKTIIVLDEPHHLNYNENKKTVSGWAQVALSLLDKAGYRISMTGTPFRTDEDEKIPYARYEENGASFVLVPDYSYSYGQAVRDGVVAEVIFEKAYGNGRYSYRDKIYEFDLKSSGPKDDEAKILKSVLNIGTEFAQGIINQGVAKLEQIRTKDNNYAGLIVCKDMAHAREIKQHLLDEYRIMASLVLSDGSDGLKEINKFRGSRAKWIIAVGMVSEGTDIPRLKVLVYLSNVRTTMFFQQVMGRIVRKTIQGPEQCFMYLPGLHSVSKFIREVGKDITDTFSPRDFQKGVAPPPSEPGDFKILEASFHGVIDFSIREITPEPVVIRAYQVESFRKQTADKAKEFGEIYAKRRQVPAVMKGTLIAQIHRDANEKIGVDKQEEMSLEQLIEKDRILTAWINEYK